MKKKKGIKLLRGGVANPTKIYPLPETPQSILSRVKASVHRGNVIECTKEEYPLIRKALHQLAGEYIDDGDTVRGSIALWEVRRLDEKHMFGPPRRVTAVNRVSI